MEFFAEWNVGCAYESELSIRETEREREIQIGMGVGGIKRREERKIEKKIKKQE